MAQPLTTKQRRLLNELQSIQATLGYRPSYRELAKALGLASPATVYVHLRTLEKRGYVRRDEAGLFVPLAHVAQAALMVNLRGRLTPEGRLTPVEGRQVAVPADMVSGLQAYALEMAGDDGLPATLVAGDTIVIEESALSKNGDLVVARVEPDLLLIRRYYREATSIRLQPLAPTQASLFVQKVSVEGIVRGLLRKFS